MVNNFCNFKTFKESLFISSIILIIMFISCKKEVSAYTIEDIIQHNEISTKSTTGESLFSEDSLYLVSLFGCINTLEQFDSCYVINGDQLISTDDLAILKQTANNRMFGRVLPNNVQHIYVVINNYGNNYSIKNNVIEALNQWNNISNCNIYFAHRDGTYNSSNEYNWIDMSIDIDPSSGIGSNVNCNSGLGILVNTAITPEPSRKITVNSSNSSFSQLNDSQKTFAIMHALGHALGLNDAESNSNWIPGTSGTYATSIMNSYDYNIQNGLVWQGFTDNDKEDLGYIYPLLLINPRFSVNGIISNGEMQAGCNYDIELQYDAIKQYDNCSICYSVSSSDVTYDPNSIEGHLSIISYSSGDVNVLAEVKNSVGDILDSYNENFSVIGNAPIFPSNIALGESFTLEWPCDDGESLALLITENYFDNDDRNVSYTQSSNSTYSLRILDYGDYTITLKQFKASRVIGEKSIHVRKLFRTDYSFEIRDTLTRSIPHWLLPNQIYACPEDMSQLVVTSVNNPNYVRFGDNNKLTDRIAFNTYNIYFRDAFIPPQRVDRRPVCDTTYFTLHSYPKGYDSRIELPAANNGYISIALPGWLNYYGRKGVMIPDDVYEIY